MEHYYSKKPQSTFTKETWQYTLSDLHFTFTSGSGVFSKGRIDFGSELLIKTFKEPPIQGGILDLGCGYGAIGIILAKIYQRRKITMVDINERAVELTNENIKQNKLNNAQVFQSDGTTNFINDKNFAAIVMNPPIRAGKKKMYGLFEQAKELLQPSNGEFWVVIQKKQGAASTEKYLSTIFTEVAIINRKKGYVILKCN